MHIKNGKSKVPTTCASHSVNVTRYTPRVDDWINPSCLNNVAVNAEESLNLEGSEEIQSSEEQRFKSHFSDAIGQEPDCLGERATSSGTTSDFMFNERRGCLSASPLYGGNSGNCASSTFVKTVCDINTWTAR